MISIFLHILKNAEAFSLYTIIKTLFCYLIAKSNLFAALQVMIFILALESRIVMISSLSLILILSFKLLAISIGFLLAIRLSFPLTCPFF